MTQVPLTIIPEHLGIHIRIRALFDDEPSDKDIAEATSLLGYNSTDISFVHRKQNLKEGDEYGLWHALWTIKI